MKSLSLAYAIKRKSKRGQANEMDMDDKQDFLTESMETPFESEPMDDEHEDVLGIPASNHDEAVEDDNMNGNSMLDSIMRKMRKNKMRG